MTTEDPRIFHITDQAALSAAEKSGSLVADSLESEKFIHCSRASQLPGVLSRFFKTATSVLLVELETAKLTSELKWDVVYPPETFPHIYGPINMDAVTRTIRGERENTDAEFKFTPPISTE